MKLQLKDADCEAFLLRIIETKLGDCPAHFFITFPANERPDPAWTYLWQAGGGRGFEREPARRAAICEALERACLITSGPADARVVDRDHVLSPEEHTLRWMNFSSKQLQTFGADAKNNAKAGCGIPVEKLWMDPHRISTSERNLIPALAVLFGEDSRSGLPSVYSTSTGTAVRDTVADAARHATLELVERDAVAIWWYNRLDARPFPPQDARGAFPDNFSLWLSNRQRITWHLVMPSDLPVTTVVALSARADGSRPAIGASAALDPADAVRSATLEMLQGEIALVTMRAAQRGADPPPPPPLLAWSESTNAFGTPFLMGAGPPHRPEVATFADLEDHCAEAGIEIVTVDLTRPELGVPVVKALSPQLRDWLPRFGPGRLYDVPVALGLRATPLAETELNPVPFVI